MKLALTGAQGTGKTTLLNTLKEYPEFANVDFLPEITRTIKNQGFPINEAGTLDTQILVMNAHMQNLLLHSNFIVDRCLLDGYVYSLYLKQELPQHFLNYARCLVDEYICRYDAIFYLPVEFSIANDGVRSLNPEFQGTIAKYFETLINMLSTLKKPNIIKVTGSVEARAAKVIEVVRSLK